MWQLEVLAYYFSPSQLKRREDLIALPAHFVILLIFIARTIYGLFFWWPILLMDILLTSAEECIQREHPDHKDLWRWIFMLYSTLVFILSNLAICFLWP